jgi:hypothetical protein
MVRRSRIIVCNRQRGRRIEKGVVIRRSKITIHNRQKKKYIYKINKRGFY